MKHKFADIFVNERIILQCAFAVHYLVTAFKLRIDGFSSYDQLKYPEKNPLE
jgi:hypothetical protein